MKRKTKWLLFAAALIYMAVVWLCKTPQENPEPASLLPVLAISVVILLLKTGLFTAALLGLKKLWEQFRRK